MSCKEYPNRNCMGCPECKIELATRLYKNQPTLHFNLKELFNKELKEKVKELENEQSKRQRRNQRNK